MSQNSGNLEQIKEFVKKQAVEKIKKELIKKAWSKTGAVVLADPNFWIVTGILLGTFIAFFLLAAIVSTTGAVASQIRITEQIVPPQIYVTDMEKTITSDFGPRIHPVTGQVDSYHNGLDLGIPSGTPVLTSTDGVVSIVSYPRETDPSSTQNAGIYVAVQSTTVGVTTRYLHLSEAFVTPGQVVRKGEIIGLSGNTGRSTGPHLHYEMIPDGGEPIDPKPFVMLISKVMDTAAVEALRNINKIQWGNVAENLDENKPYYESKKMLYISNVYYESAAPAFSEQGAALIRTLSSGGTTDTGTIIPDMSTAPAPSIEEPVSVPVDIGQLTHPFFIQYAAAAMREEARSGVPASITLAQAALESGYGRAAICNNMFGIKANIGYRGPSCSTATHEEINGSMVVVNAKFRSYTSPDASFADHSNFLLQNKRYRIALTKENPYEFANELQRAGYATDSQYANKLKSIIRKQNLASLDQNGGVDPVTGQPFTDVSYVGGSGGDSIGGGLAGTTITVNFGIRQYYGEPASEQHTCSDANGNAYTCYTLLKDPENDSQIVNLVHYNRVLQLVRNQEDILPPNISMKDVPDAISVTISGDGDDDFNIIELLLKKGMY